MTKKIAISIINLYQAIFSPILKNLLGTQKFCRYDVTCSEYTKRKIAEDGILSGIVQGAVRLSKCQPFYNMAGTK